MIEKALAIHKKSFRSRMCRPVLGNQK